MIQCWNCHRSFDENELSCAFCGAAVPKKKKAQPAAGAAPAAQPPPAQEPAPAPPPRPAPRPLSQLAPRERQTYTLNDPAAAAEAAGLLRGEAASGRGTLGGMLRAMRHNARAAALLVVCVCVVALSGVTATSTLPPPRVEAVTAKSAEEQGLFYSSATPSEARVILNGQSVAVVEAWVAKIGKIDGPKGLLQSAEDRLRLYFRLKPHGGGPFEVYTGPTEQRARRMDGGGPDPLYYVDLFARINPPVKVTLKDPEHPERGAATFSIKM